MPESRSVQQTKALTRAPIDTKCGAFGRADSPGGSQLASLSATPSYSYQPTLPQEATHQSMPNRASQFKLQASAAVSTGRNMSIWSSFLEHDCEPHSIVPNLDEEDAWSNDGDDSELVTAVD